MSKRIGEVLIERGFLSRGQLAQALRLQLIFGGHLGTCLVELGFVDEAVLARTLSSILGMKCARIPLLDDIPAEILRKIPREQVQRRRVVPFGIRREALHVAVTSPRSVAGLSAIVGHAIVPYLAPEIYILRAMERYYGIPRRRRYLKVAYASLASEAGQPDDSTRDSVVAPAARPEAPLGDPPTRQSRSSRMPRLGEHSRRMSQVQDHGELGEVILDFATERMDRCILFHVEDETAGIANWRGVELPRRTTERLALPLEANSIFALALEESCFHGPLPQEFDCGGFYGELGIAVPREILVLPIYGENRLEVVLYGDGGPDGTVFGPTDTYLLLLDEIEIALRMLAFRQQLCPA